MVACGQCDALVEVLLLAESLVTSLWEFRECPTPYHYVPIQQVQPVESTASWSVKHNQNKQTCMFSQVGNLFWKQNMGIGCYKELDEVTKILSAHITNFKVIHWK